MDKFEEMSENFGTTLVDDVEYALTQDAYCTGGSFVDEHGWQHNGTWYEAAAIDIDENEYMIYWTDIDDEATDESNSCDWSCADYAIRL